MARKTNIHQSITSKTLLIRGNFPNPAFFILEPTRQVNIKIIIKIKLFTSPKMFRGLLYITQNQTMAAIRVPNHTNGFRAANIFRVNPVISSDFLDLTMSVKRDIKLPRARIIPRNSKNRVEIGLAKNCSFKRGRVNRAVKASLAGKVSIFPMAIEYFP